MPKKPPKVIASKKDELKRKRKKFGYNADYLSWYKVIENWKIGGIF